MRHVAAVAFCSFALIATFYTLLIIARFSELGQNEDTFGAEHEEEGEHERGAFTLDVHIPPNRHDDLYQVVNLTFDHQPMRLTIDTSTADSFVASNFCDTVNPESGCYGLTAPYIVRNLTALDGPPFDTFVGKGRVQGNLTTTTISINQISMPNSTIALITSAWPHEFQNNSFTGYLSLGLRTTSQIYHKHAKLPILDTLITQRKLARPMFSLRSPRFADPAHEVGKLMLGGMDSGIEEENVAFSDVLPFAMYTNTSTDEEKNAKLDHPLLNAWSAELQGLRINGVEVGVSAGRVRRDERHVAIIDSGSSYIYLRKQDFYNIEHSFNGSTETEPDETGDRVWFECARPQALEMKVNSGWYPLDPLDLLEAVMVKVVNGTEMCRSTLRTWELTTFGDSLLGLPFSRSVVAVFDYGSDDMFSVTPRLGLASTVDVDTAWRRYPGMYKDRLPST